MTPRIAVAAVTFDRPKELAVLLDSINAQTAAVDTICLVDSGKTPARDTADEHPNVDYVRSEANLGGAASAPIVAAATYASTSS